MSVLKNNRAESKVQYIDTAERLVVHTVKCCMKLPKRWTFFGVTHVVELAHTVLECCRGANSIYVKTRQDFEYRRHLLLQGNVAVQAMISELGILIDLMHENPETQKWVENAARVWGDLLNQEAKLIAGVRAYDESKFPQFLS